jgi:hypothetical protein
MSHGGRIRDPVHGYGLIDDALVQRLRYVGQAGLSHLVFPEVRTPRFSHSLGVMHLSSRFLAAALANAGASLRATVEGLIAEAVTDATAGYPPAEAQVVQVLTEDGLRSASSVSDSARASALLLEQGLRLAGLVHYLGHLPFSHDFEYAFDRLLEQHRADALTRFPALTEEGNLATHERIGYRLARTLVHKVFDDVPERFEADLARASFAIAERILLAEPPSDPGLAVAREPALDTDALWWWLHSLMAGEIDVDRCDYLLRDARNCPIPPRRRPPAAAGGDARRRDRPGPAHDRRRAPGPAGPDRRACRRVLRRRARRRRQIVRPRPLRRPLAPTWHAGARRPPLARQPDARRPGPRQRHHAHRPPPGRPAVGGDVGRRDGHPLDVDAYREDGELAPRRHTLRRRDAHPHARVHRPPRHDKRLPTGTAAVTSPGHDDPRIVRMHHPKDAR